MTFAHFILIQNDQVLDHADDPMQLSTTSFDEYAGFKIAVGCLNNWSDCEIIGIAADVAPLPSTAWRISSNQDGMRRLINSATNPLWLVLERLRVMFDQGWFDDLHHLPTPVIITPA